jgi:hypothetical protein
MLLTLPILLFMLGRVGGNPFYVVTSPVPKCVTVEVPSETMVHISWDIPELKHLVDQAGRKKQTILTISQTAAINESKFTEQFKKKDKKKRRKNKSPTKTEILEQASSKIMYMTETDGPVQACIRAQGASAKSPVRISIVVETGHDAAHYLHEEQEHHLSKVQLQFLRLQDSLGNILKEADSAKERETEFHNQSVSMHAATRWWPMVQIMVLLITGFTQASAMVNFFKSKRLI